MSSDQLSSLLRPGALHSVFQPVVDVRGAEPEIYAWEGLTRGPVGTNLERPDVLFEYVRRKNAADLLDRMCIARCIERFGELPGDARLSLNVHASTLALDVKFADFLRRAADQYKLDLRRLTLEVVEHAPAWDGAAFSARLAELRRLGVGIALDDIGLGYANFRMFLEAEPDWIKIDRYLVRNLHADARRRAILESLQSLAKTCGAEIVAEGVERHEELAAVCDLGIGLVQGFLFGRPMSAGHWSHGEQRLPSRSFDSRSAGERAAAGWS